jgi:lipoyl(octanoyl) transferase
MSSASFDPESPAPALQAFLLGQVGFDRALALQQRLVEEAHNRGDGQITLLLCEHPTIITIGRGGSPGDVATQSNLVRSGQVEVRWVNRGGGALMHAPGQLAIYPIVPLRWREFSVGRFLERFQTGIVEALDDLNVSTRRSQEGGTSLSAAKGVVGRSATPFTALRGVPPALPQPARGICGRTGQVASLGIAVRHWIAYYGAYLNVCPPMGLFRLIEPQMSCLVAERCGPVRMTGVRAALVRRLAERFGCDRYHLYTGHPLLRTK